LCDAPQLSGATFSATDAAARDEGRGCRLSETISLDAKCLLHLSAGCANWTVMAQSAKYEFKEDPAATAIVQSASPR